jgi:hypothetical protein
MYRRRIGQSTNCEEELISARQSNESTTNLESIAADVVPEVGLLAIHDSDRCFRTKL